MLKRTEGGKSRDSPLPKMYGKTISDLQVLSTLRLGARCAPYSSNHIGLNCTLPFTCREIGLFNLARYVIPKAERSLGSQHHPLERRSLAVQGLGICCPRFRFAVFMSGETTTP